jgi:hypothetical protein
LPLQSSLNFISIVKKSVKESFTIKNIFTIFIFVILAIFSRFIFAQYNISAFIDLFALISILFSTDMISLPIEGFIVNKPFTSLMMNAGNPSGGSSAGGTRGSGATASSPIVIEDDSDTGSPAPDYILRKDQFTYYSATDKYEVNDPVRVKPSLLGYASTKGTGHSHQPYASNLSDAMKDAYDRGGAVSTHIMGRFSDDDLAYLRELHQDMVKSNEKIKFQNSKIIRKALKDLH